MYKLIQGDCLEKMKDIQDGSVDLILTDPPYGLTDCKWDSVIQLEPMWAQLNRIIKPNGAIVLFGSEPFSSTLRMSNINDYKYDWIWEKEYGTGALHSKNMPLKNHENISVFSKGKIGHKGKVKNRMVYMPQGLKKCDKTYKRKNWGMEGTLERKSQSNSVRTFFQNYPKTILKYNRDTEKYHPTQKPVALLEYLIKTYTNKRETVLDFTMGSGSTGVACANTNRNFIGIDSHERYFNIAKQRIYNALLDSKQEFDFDVSELVERVKIRHKKRGELIYI